MRFLTGLCFLLFFSSANFFFSQGNNDTLEVSRLLDSAKKIVYSDAATSQKIAFSLIKKASKLENKKFLGGAYFVLGIIKTGEADIKSAKAYYDTCAVEYRKSNFVVGLCMYYNNMGLLLNKEGSYREALSFYLAGLKISDSLHNEVMNARFYNNIGFLYNNMEQYKLALPYFKKALFFHEKNSNKAQAAKVLQNMAISYELLDDFVNAEGIYLKAIRLEEELQDSATLAITLDNLGSLFMKQKKYSKAIPLIEKAYSIIINGNNKAEWALIANNLSEVFIETKEQERALKFAKEAFDIAVSSGLKREQTRACHLLAAYYTQIQDYKTAGAYLRKENELTLSLFNEEVASSSSEMMVKYETEKKENENKLLQQKNSISALSLENTSQKLELRNRTIFVLIAVLVIVAVLVFWQLSLARLKKQKRALEEQRKIQLERERISRDLHDNVGGQLSYVLFSLEGEETLAKEKAQTLAGSIRSITRNLRETIWALNQEKLTLKDLSDKLKLYTRNMFSYSNTKIKFEERIENDAELNPVFALNLFRICQEIVNNCFKHANASELLLNFERREKIKIIISDNGKGFDLARVNSSDSYGLQSLRSRAKEIGAEVIIESTVGKGTKTTLIV